MGFIGMEAWMPTLLDVIMYKKFTWSSHLSLLRGIGLIHLGPIICLDKKIGGFHYKALQLAMKDRVRRITIDRATEWHPPKQWIRFALSSFFMKIFYHCKPVSLEELKMSNTNVIGRRPGLIFEYDTSDTRIGKQMTKDWFVRKTLDK